MWTYRRMLKISWKDHKTNEEVLRMANTKRSLLSNIKERKLKYFGHIVRAQGIHRMLLEGRINGKRSRGRPRTTWFDNIKEWTKLSYGECVRIAEKRQDWRSLIFNLLRAEETWRRRRSSVYSHLCFFPLFRWYQKMPIQRLPSKSWGSIEGAYFESKRGFMEKGA